MKIFKNAKGLTLIELLIVIAILGILAAVILVAIDPLEQFARGRDASRKSSVGQMGHAVQSYYTASGGTTYPTNNVADTTWMATLVSAGEFRNTIIGPAYGSGISACSVNQAPGTGFCYNTDGTNAVVWARLESKAEGGQNSGATNAKCPIGQFAYWVYVTNAGQAGRLCGPAVGFSPSLTATSPDFIP